MKIAIASLGRFHVLDLARELEARGADIAFYSYVRRARAERFGLPRRCHKALFPLVAPALAWQYKAGNVLPGLQEKAVVHALDAAVIAKLEPCDVFICMSGTYLRAARHAKARYGAKIYLERGSRHIRSQRAILADLGARLPSDFIVAREETGYALADRITVPSSHVVESFLQEAPALGDKLFVNPYGVDLAQFPQRTAGPPDRPRTVLFVGGWSRRKGVDVLVEAVRMVPDARLLHVGGIVDMPFPDDPRFTHVGPVPQWELTNFYAKAHVFALASREEGLALVQAQALASGLPLVCTDRTGGGDLGLSGALARRIAVVPRGDATAFAAAIQAQLSKPPEPLPEADRALLDWSAYGARYFAELSGLGYDTDSFPTRPVRSAAS